MGGSARRRLPTAKRRAANNTREADLRESNAGARIGDLIDKIHRVDVFTRDEARLLTLLLKRAASAQHAPGNSDLTVPPSQTADAPAGGADFNAKLADFRRYVGDDQERAPAEAKLLRSAIVNNRSWLVPLVRFYLACGMREAAAYRASAAQLERDIKDVKREYLHAAVRQ